MDSRRSMRHDDRHGESWSFRNRVLDRADHGRDIRRKTFHRLGPSHVDYGGYLCSELLYTRHAEWKYVLKLLPWAVAGIIFGALFGKAVNDDQFKKAIGLMVIIFIGLMIWQDFRKKDVTIPDFWWFSALLGLAGGFSTMVGNAAGPVMSMYLLSMRLPKNRYIGTAAWFFFIVNLLKVPLHVFYWKTIHIQSLAFDLMMIPAILLGAFLGIRIVKIIPEKGFRIFVICTTLLAAILLF